MMADENVTTACDDFDDSDDDESEDKWFAPTDKLAESAQSDERGTDEASCWKDMQSSFDKCNPHSVKDYVIGRIQSVAESAQSDERATDEASGWNDMQSSSDKSSPTSVEDYTIGRIQSDDVDEILAQICDPIETIDLQTTADYIKQCLKRCKIRFALLGRSAAGKSTFINTLRGVKEGQEGFADVGFGNTVEKITEYKHPLNENIIFCEVPGLSMKFNQSKFQKMAKLSSYNYILLFFESVLTVDDEWLMVQIQKKGIPFCLVRSKVDNEVNSNKGRKVGEKDTLLQIRQTIKDSLSDIKAFAKVEVFLISSEKPYIGEMSKLQDHIKEKLPSNQYSSGSFAFQF